MKITCGLGSIDDYDEYVKAGADEVFIGYVPGRWMDAFGERTPLNRREVLYYNVQIGSKSELLILKDMIKELKIPVSVTLNALSFDEKQVDLILNIVKECHSLGIFDFIVADEKLLAALSAAFGEKIRIHLSGEFGELNSLVLDEVNVDGLVRVIFPRQTSIEEMECLIKSHPELEYEAFILNEKCHFTGAYCKSIHCDEMCHACKLPYKICRIDEDPNGEISSSGAVKAFDDSEIDIKNIDVLNVSENQDEYEDAYMVPGATGCGLCALWKLKEIGVTHIKIVSRGNDSQSTISDIKLIKQALFLLEKSKSEKEFAAEMKKSLFPSGCSKNCYYIIDKK